MKRFGFFFSVLLLLISHRVTAQLPDGIYAVWDTQHGSMTAVLYHVRAPMTVANFVGLAEGTRPWVEESTGHLRTGPYFTGLIVNRIADIPTTIVQTGSQNGSNSGGGPGYTFKDEFHPDLRHDGHGVVSMANSGMNSNGTQYFFTTGALAHLDDKHNVFGKLVGGSNTLDTIASLSLTNGVPVTDVVFQDVRILRIGAAAQAFDVDAQGLPSLAGMDMSVRAPVTVASNTTYIIDFTQTSNTIYSLYLGEEVGLVEEIGGWVVRGVTASNDTVVIPLVESNGTHVSTVYQAAYPHSVAARSPQNLHLTATDNFFDVQFNPLGNGLTSATYENGTFTGGISVWSYNSQDLAITLVLYSPTYTYTWIEFQLGFTEPGANPYRAKYYNSSGQQVAETTGFFTHSGGEPTP